MNNSNVSICTDYSVIGNRIISDFYQFLIVDRKNPTKTKAKKYLLHVADNQNRTYVSSLYPVGNSQNKYKFDFRNTVYFLTVEGEAAFIKSTL
tara:strand:+ start:944 stop:1222 length:279 start_codon:yes stop_codon:yes gene_type:complete